LSPPNAAHPGGPRSCAAALRTAGRDSDIPWRVNAGLGLDLIGRVCLQLGWTLELGAEGEVFQARVIFGAK
jgi:hypothetical protein